MSSSNDEKPPGTTSRSWWKFAAAFLLIAVLFYGSPVLWVEFDDGASTPSLSQAQLPAGLVVDGSEMSCASGGCWLDVSIDREASMPDALSELAQRDGSCQIVSPFDMRRVCVDIGGIDDKHVFVSYKRVLGL